jgi:hypothetical protein
VQCLLPGCVIFIQYVRSVTCIVCFYICFFETFLMFLLYLLNILSFLLEIHQWVTESPYFVNHLTFMFVDYVYIPICLAYMKWMDTITCSQSWDKWLDRWTVFMNKYYKNFLFICCIRSSFVMKLCFFKAIYSMQFESLFSCTCQV